MCILMYLFSVFRGDSLQPVSFPERNKMPARTLDKELCHSLAIDHGTVLSQVFSSVEGTLNPECGETFESPF